MLRRELVLVSSAPASLQSALEAQGFSLVVVADCDRALPVIQRHMFDGLLIDLPEEYDRGFLQRLRHIDAALQVVILSDRELQFEEQSDLGVDLVARGEPLQKLRQALCRAVELTRLRRDNFRLRQQLATVGAAQTASHARPSEIVAERPSSSAAPGLAIGGEADLAAISRAHVTAVLAQHNGNKARTARALGINRRSLYRLLEKYSN